MKMEEVRALREAWGDQPCDQDWPLEKEYYLGASTGDYVCTRCGNAGPGRGWPEKNEVASLNSSVNDEAPEDYNESFEAFLHLIFAHFDLTAGKYVEVYADKAK